MMKHGEHLCKAFGAPEAVIHGTQGLVMGHAYFDVGGLRDY